MSKYFQTRVFSYIYILHVNIKIVFFIFSFLHIFSLNSFQFLVVIFIMHCYAIIFCGRSTEYNQTTYVTRNEIEDYECVIRRNIRGYIACTFRTRRGACKQISSLPSKSGLTHSLFSGISLPANTNREKSPTKETFFGDKRLVWFVDLAM